MFLRVLTLAAIITSAVMPMEAAEQPIGDTGKAGCIDTNADSPSEEEIKEKTIALCLAGKGEKENGVTVARSEEEKSPSPSPSETASLPTPAASEAVAPTSTVSPSPGETPAAQNQCCRRRQAEELPTLRYHAKQ